MAATTIGIAAAFDGSFAREVALGVMAVVHRRGWAPVLLRPDPDGLRQGLARVQPAGVVLKMGSGSLAQEAVLRAAGIPAVNIGQLVAGSRLPHVGNDDRAIGVLAARHLIERGCRRLYAVGDEAVRMERLRIAGARDAARAAGLTLQRILIGEAASRLPPLIQRATGVAGVFAINDWRGAQVVMALRDAGIAIPEQAAVIGVDNEDLACRLCHPELSSVAVAQREIGSTAAELLAGMIAGGAAPGTRFLAPLGIVVRASSDGYAVADRDLGAACAFIRGNVHRRIGPEDVVAAVPLSRSSLQRRFRETFGRTLREAIREARIAHARRLLLDTDQKLAAVARAAGFANAAQLVRQFHAAEGATPEAWRRRFRHG